MTRNRRMATMMGGLCAVAGGSSALIANSHLGNLGDGLRGLVMGMSLGLSVVFLMRSKRE